MQNEENLRKYIKQLLVKHRKKQAHLYNEITTHIHNGEYHSACQYLSLITKRHAEMSLHIRSHLIKHGYIESGI